MSGTKNRNAGHTFERQWAKTFRDAGYVFCKTTRQASRLLDSCKIDLAFIPYNFQCKKVKASINYKDLILSIKKELKENIPEEDIIHNYPIIIAHKRGRLPEDHLIIMEASSFVDMMKKIREYDIIENQNLKNRSKIAKNPEILLD